MISTKTGVLAGFDLNGASVYKSFLDRAAQEEMVIALRQVVACAPLFSPMTPYGRPMSVRLTSAGRFGWISDKTGYRYEPRHPGGMKWPPIPEPVLAVWQAVSGSDRVPDCCLLNFYGEDARMGMHQDRDESDFAFPVVSISLGDEAQFRIGTTTRGGPTKSHWLASGDVLVLGGKARLAYHGVDKIRFGSSTLLKEGGRINLTMRVVE